MLRKIWVVVLGACTYTMLVQQAPASEMSILAMQGRPVAQKEILHSIDNIQWNQATTVKVDSLKVEEISIDVENATDDTIFKDEDELKTIIESK